MVVGWRKAASQLTLQRPPKRLCVPPNFAALLATVVITSLMHWALQAYLQHQSFYKKISSDSQVLHQFHFTQLSVLHVLHKCIHLHLQASSTTVITACDKSGLRAAEVAAARLEILACAACVHICAKLAMQSDVTHAGHSLLLLLMMMSSFVRGDPPEGLCMAIFAQPMG